MFRTADQVPPSLWFLPRLRLNNMKTFRALIGVLTAGFFCNGSVALAANFTISTASTTAQTLGSGQTGVVTSSGSLTLGGTTVPITVTGSSTITNSGQILQAGTGRAITNETGTVTLGITNNVGALIQTANGDALRITPATSSVTLDNYGTITSLNGAKGGSQAVDWSNITSGSNVLTNYSTGLIQSSDADSVRPGVNGVIYNYGTIKSTVTTDTGSDGIDVQNNTGVTITNYPAGLVEGARHGITGGAKNTTVTFTTTVTNNAGGTIKGDNGSGINLDGFDAKQTATVSNAGTITGNGHDIGDGLSHDGDGIDVDGIVNLTNTGTIRSINAFSPTTAGLAYSEGVTVGGGTITNSGTIEGLVAAGNLNAVGRGISLLGNDIVTGPLTGTREAIYGNATVTNLAGGLIRGQTDSGIAVDGPASGFIVTINNNAGATIRGAGATAATIQTGADNDTVNNAGAIINDGGDSKVAISLGAGDDQLNINGGAAVIVGGIDGGSGSNKLAFNLGAANNVFTHSGVISNFNKVDVLSGKVILNGNNTYLGTTTVGGGSAAASLRVNGRHSGGSGYTVLSGSILGGTGIFSLADASTKIDIQSGASLHIGGGQLTVEKGSLNVAGIFSFDLNGTTAGVAGGYDQLLFTAGNDGTISLTDTSTLLLNLGLGFATIAGQEFTLIDIQNSSTHINGLFAGLAEGAVFNVDGDQFQISYVGGTGNDLVLTAIPEPATTAITAGACALVFAFFLRRRNAVAA